MPSWNIHTAHVERLLSQRTPDELGIEDGFIQELSSSDEKYIPRFDLTGI